ncbi:MAG: PaaI family thioesterase [Lentisphaerae bacterium]|jgi:acyl-CoA thioesterase|nr:PaaI family thioesterase [Lentisphaerota bacterium]
MATSELILKDQFVKFVGIELLDAGDGMARAQLKIEEYHLNGLGIAQGGAIFTLADYAFAAAANSHEQVAVTLNSSIAFMRPVGKGVLTAVCREIARNRRTAFYTVDVLDESGETVALFNGTAYLKSIDKG